MLTITQRGDTYRIRAYCGYDAKGKQVCRSTTWRPAPGMTAKQIEKEVQRQAVLFEEKCAGQGLCGNIKFEAFARQWFQEHAEPNLRPRTVARLHQHEERVYSALGHVRLDKLTARQIQAFLQDLGKAEPARGAGRPGPRLTFPPFWKSGGSHRRSLRRSPA